MKSSFAARLEEILASSSPTLSRPPPLPSNLQLRSASPSLFNPPKPLVDKPPLFPPNSPNPPHSTNPPNLRNSTNPPISVNSPNLRNPPISQTPTNPPTSLPSAAAYYASYLNLSSPSPTLSRSDTTGSKFRTPPEVSLPLSYPSSTSPSPPRREALRSSAPRYSSSSLPLSSSNPQPIFTPLKRPSNNPKDYLVSMPTPLSFPSLPRSPALPLAPPSLLTSPDDLPPISDESRYLSISFALLDSPFFVDF